MVKFASYILSNREKITLTADEKLTYAQLVQVGSSAGGARAKALISWNNERTNEVRSGQKQLDEGFDYWLMKFDHVSKNGDHGLEDHPEYTLIEYAYYKIAVNGKNANIGLSDLLDAGMNMGLREKTLQRDYKRSRSVSEKIY